MAALKRSGGEPCAFSPWVSSTAGFEPLCADTQPIFINPSRLLTADREKGALFAILDLLGAHENSEGGLQP